MKGFKLLARLMGRGAGGNVPLLYARAFHRPLMVEPGLGESLIHGYLAAAEAGEGERRSERLLTVEEGLAVVDVSGALLAHDTVGFCGETPTSYPALSRALNDALEDPAVETILFRMDSPGGEADGCFDLADQIYASRGQKKLVAVVDHMAYSAAYAIASACDEIWLSRTAGVGSVGVVTYHVDQSEFNAKHGIKIEYIQAGARKTDFSPHKPLTDEARGWLQAEIDRLGDMFVETVARNRGLTVEQVRATEAGCFFADGAIEAGLADHVGTFAQALASHSGSFASMQVAEGSGAQMEAAEAGALDEATQGGEQLLDEGSEDAGLELAASGDELIAATAEKHLLILEMCTAAGAPELAAEHIKAGTDLEELRAKLDMVGEIRAVCAAAGMPEKVAEFVRVGAKVEDVRTSILAAVAARDTADISNRIEPRVSAPARAPDRESIYEKRREATRK